MPKYIIVDKKNKSKNPWIAHAWGNDPESLKKTSEIDSSIVRHFEKSIWDKNIGDLIVNDIAEKHPAEILLVQLHETSRLHTAKKAAKKKAAPKKKSAAMKRAAKKRGGDDKMFPEFLFL